MTNSDLAGFNATTKIAGFGDEEQKITDSWEDLPPSHLTVTPLTTHRCSSLMKETMMVWTWVHGHNTLLLCLRVLGQA